MGKISEQKALEAYPIESHEFYDCDYKKRNAYVKGYEQAMQDFLEKACTFLKNRTMPELCLDPELTELVDDFVEQFKNYMQNES